VSTTNTEAFDDLNKVIENALTEIKRMNYTMALKAVLIKMLEECEVLEAKGQSMVEMTNLIRIANDYTMYLTDSPNDVPKGV
jgi:hypothetical protein